MPTPVNEDGITRFKLSPEEREVVKLTKCVNELENNQNNISSRLTELEKKAGV